MTEATIKWTFDIGLRKKVDSIFSSFTNSTPGAALGIYREGEVIYANGYGMANLEHSTPIGPDSVFYIASVSKQFTAMCIALLAADGALGIEDDIRKYVTLADGITEPITIRHLLHHVSGLREQFSLLNLAGWRTDDIVTNDDVLNLVSRQKSLTAPPNTEYRYCNTGYTLLSIIVEKVAGKTMREFAQECIFGPLGMTSTHFHDNHAEMVPNRTYAYETRNDGGYNVSIPMLDIIGDGGLYTTINDMAKWDGNFANPIVGDTALIESMQTPDTFANGEAMTYAWGLGTGEFCGFRKVSHGGAMAGYRSHYLRLPELEFSIAIFANHADIQPGVLVEEIASIVLGDLLMPTEPNGASTAPPSPFEDVKMTEPGSLAGSYSEVDGNNHLVIACDEDTAFVKIEQQNLLFHRQDDGTYTQKWGHFVIAPTELDNNGSVLTLQALMVHENRIITLNRVTTSPVHDPQRYAGQYYSSEMDAVWEVAIDEETDGITVRRPRHESQLYQPLAPSRFGHGGLGMGGSIAFTTPDGTIFEYVNERIGSFSFIRLK